MHLFAAGSHALACDHHSNLCLHLYMASPSSVCLISLYLSLIRAIAMAFRVHPDNPGLSPHLKIFNLIIYVKTLFPNKITFTGSGV